MEVQYVVPRDGPVLELLVDTEVIVALYCYGFRVWGRATPHILVHMPLPIIGVQDRAWCLWQPRLLWGALRNQAIQDDPVIALDSIRLTDDIGNQYAASLQFRWCGLRGWRWRLFHALPEQDVVQQLHEAVASIWVQRRVGHTIQATDGRPTRQRHETPIAHDTTQATTQVWHRIDGDRAVSARDRNDTKEVPYPTERREGHEPHA